MNIQITKFFFFQQEQEVNHSDIADKHDIVSKFSAINLRLKGDENAMV